MAKPRPSRLRPLTLRLLNAPARAHTKTRGTSTCARVLNLLKVVP
ncbi:hypothetical protein LRHMDP2_2014 [Lacticaseibacillus rhamnosus LRHMDP2]|uniref:Uncharacterized protein n=1 Tax=Lacticaseibacillus rhamnosus LRHMDP3 TaxID=1203259 RepID=A0AB33XQS4_LACRH|nr:hypothetical protein LRHMDP3_2718 [Lacticaseibacillus rhamnosus LRHMDP3]EKS50471.1 hypothetical protein LRHMDP2_2014 [Lacticaseibacillus rhamnosus LRHMDP2]